MAQNTNNLEGYTNFSSVSLVGSGATLQALDINASRYTSTGTLIAQEVWASLVSAPGQAISSTLTANNISISATTSNASFIPANLPTGGFIFSVISGTQNGATLAYNSGTTVYVFYSAVSAAQK